MLTLWHQACRGHRNAYPVGKLCAVGNNTIFARFLATAGYHALDNLEPRIKEVLFSETAIRDGTFTTYVTYVLFFISFHGEKL